MTVDEYKVTHKKRHRTTTEAVYDVYLPLRPMERLDIFHSGMAINDVTGGPLHQDIAEGDEEEGDGGLTANHGALEPFKSEFEVGKILVFRFRWIKFNIIILCHITKYMRYFFLPGMAINLRMGRYRS